MEPTEPAPVGGAPDTRKRPFQGGREPKRQRTRKEKPVQEGSKDEVLIADVRALFAAQKLSDSPRTMELEASSLEATTGTKVEPQGKDAAAAIGNAGLPEPFSETEVEVLEISSTGDGLARHPSSDQIYVVPFGTPGDVLRVKVIRHYQAEHYTLADYISVVKPGPLRDDTRVNCQYFTRCSGCQFQMLDYSEQLKHKKTIVEKAFKNFSQLPPELVPVIGDTIGSPLQYEYRTKLTPHFDGPKGYISKKDKMRGVRNYFDEVPDIGFMQKGLKRTLDIEDCPIGTDAVRMGMKRERLRVATDLKKYAKGATILLRESTMRVQNDSEEASKELPDTIKKTTPTHTDFKSCITDNNATSTEYIDNFVFNSVAGSFFQNNNSILPVFTQYIRDHIMPPPSSTGPRIKHLIDAYSGSGLFTITLSSLFTTSTGIDISVASIASARENAKLNNLPPSQCSFIAADAPELFKSVTYPRDETVVVLDPPRKGCDESFLSQLLSFGPRRVVYVSCNVHTQARDVGVMVRGLENGGTRYRIESLRGFDFFPQTGHVEGVCVLSRVDDDEVKVEASE
ncbi:tRNA (uracil-5-)-methyltransferase [Drepanopeziza brunnea f. sp. 'multigermtubi' MB_m1]|uniref:tRNA (uracil(54)-C(5))-methyltransferase n=1 Tax=Marssonina brunnea f. sp. multigermtubi (strain MB_m1) TaxID=1072389 RepID=K1WQH7_MARBU|nr:tRNA (uracil-5-)-methyltransferase [Drepanopeziza brunnea f. sp. 'multigermtubi' MB_m1]EKD15236.1 tRNA (uracil-5-)-methyltransferase [Drepanopeziza brunnea f. sp. 'multigermtubi' MB_m1]